MEMNLISNGNDINDTNYKSWWKEKSVLEKRLIIILAGVGIILFGCVLYIVIKPTSNTHLCSTSGCLTVASRVEKHVDKSVDPCENFFKFVCGKIINETGKSWYTKPSNLLHKKTKRQLLHILNSNSTTDRDDQLLKNLKLYFQSCMDEATAQEQSLKILKEMLAKLNGWPVVVGVAWKDEQFNWSETISMLRNEGYFNEIFIRIRLKEHPTNIHENAIFIKRLYDYRQTDSKAYLELMVKAAELLGADKNFADIEMRDVYNFTQKLNKIGLGKREKSNTITTIEEFQKKYSNIDWLRFINAYSYNLLNITKITPIIDYNEDLWNEIFSFLNKTPPRVISNYIIWKVIEDIMQFISYKFNELKENYNCLQSIENDRSELCYSLANESPVLYIEYIKQYLPQRNVKQVHEIFENLRTEFKNQLSRSTWLPTDNKNAVLKKIDELVPIIGSSGKTLDDIVYQMLDKIDKKDNLNIFLNMYLYQKRQSNILEFYQLFTNSGSLETMFYYYLTPEVDAFYIHDDNTIAMPVALLQSTYYNPDGPTYFNYGSLGVVIGSELISGFIHINRLFANEQLWSEKTKMAFENRTNCITPNISILESQLKIMKISQVAGIELAYNAYKNWLEANGNDRQLYGVDYTPYQLFWISTITSECYDAYNNEDLGYKYNFHRDNDILRNNPSFSNDFKCAPNSPMNPANKCLIF